MGLSSSTIGCVLSILMLFCIGKCYAESRVFNILEFGGRPDAKMDNSQALSKAWSEACANNGGGVVVIPSGRFLVLPSMLRGPCNSFIHLQIDGELLAPKHKRFAIGSHWLSIQRVDNLFINGTGRLHGQGSTAWPYDTADRPITLRLNDINTARITNITSYNSKFFHFGVHKCQDITFDHVTLIAPANSPNTDGIHISSSSRINIKNSVISTGDDCISLGPGSKFINITNVQCGLGHGISIGSLGKYPNEEDVFEVTVRDSTFFGTINGVRIKSWSSSFSSVVSNITFLNLQMNNVENPIIIDQNYQPNEMSKSRVQIREVRYEGIRGNSSTKVAVDFECSQVNPCQGIVLQDINLRFNGGGQATSTCHNVRGSAFGQQLPPSCL